MAILQGNPEAATVGIMNSPEQPLVLLRTWLEQAAAMGVQDHQAMVLGTVQANGRPRARVVSAKAVDHAGVLFGTSRRSGKGDDLAACPFASGVFWWPAIVQQVTLTGCVEELPGDASDELFAQRPREAQAVAVVSHQSAVLLEEADLSRRVREIVSQPGAIARPEHWRGFRLKVDSVEFWHGRADRMHRRLRYQLFGSTWRADRLQP